MTSKYRYIRELQRMLEDCKGQIDALKADVRREGPKTRAELEKHIDELRLRCRAAQQKIDEIRASKDAGWEELRDGADHMWSGLKQLVKDTRSAFQEGRDRTG
jgi:predicted  nucleic acid-binding Zn-ribbon protein